MEGHSAGLQDMFTALETGIAPGTDVEEHASRISCVIRRSSHSADREDINSVCLCLTLIGKIISKLSAQSLPQDVSDFYEGVMKRLLGDAGLISEMVSLLRCQDRLVSHLAAKCVSSLVIYDICVQGEIDSVCMVTFTETCQSSDPDCTMDSYLWTLTDLIKRILRKDSAHKAEILKKLLAGLEPTLSSLYPQLLFRAKHDERLTPKPESNRNDLNVTICTFMDLLEALMAVRSRLGLCSSVQRLMFLQTSALLGLMDSQMEYFVKKRGLLLLKRVLVQKAGEDWRLEGQKGLGGDEYLAGDMLSLADAVLREVDAGWLRRLPVKSQPSFFGGNKERFADGEGRDAVVLRAVSLILIKCLETKVRDARTGGPDRTVNVQQYVGELLTLLRLHVAQYRGHTHNCAWFLLVFGEQDDDMMEGAKALMKLYLHQRRLSPAHPESCGWGCNPHCHFTLLLQSLSFDHTVLLDFLISTETCFLEYFVLYLKHLRDSWSDFSEACCRVEGSDGTFGSSKVSLPSVSRASVSSPATTATPQPQTAAPTTSPDLAGGPSVPRLVDYESSEESGEDEGADLGHPTTRNPEELVVQTGSTEEKSGGVLTVHLLDKVMLCLAELRTVITRLHSRGLFPYNPSSLIKLIKAVEDNVAL